MRVSTLFVLLFLNGMTYAQVLSDWEVSAKNFYARVKNIEFFIDRFNHQPDGTGKVVALDRRDTVKWVRWVKDRDAVIYSLLDKKRLQKEREEYVTKVNFISFVEQVNDPLMPTYLHFSDTAWFAKVHLLAEHKGKETVIDCTLKVIQLQEDVFVWTLSSVYSEELNINETFFGALNFAPSVHGTDFMGVRIHLSDTSWVNKVRVAQAKQSNFIDMLSMGTIKIKQVQSIKYHFLQIPNWVVSVDYTYRDSDNSGWLIDSLQPANDKQKQAYRREYRLN